MTFEKFMTLQRNLLKKYECTKNIDIFNKVATDLSIFKGMNDCDITRRVAEQTVKDVLKREIENKMFINNILYEIYEQITHNETTEDIQSIIEHLESKIDLLSEFDTDSLHETVSIIVKNL